MKLLLTSGGIANKTIENELKELSSRRILDSRSR